MKLSSICPRCGGPSKMGLCDRCQLQLADLLDCPDRIELTFCPVCGSQLLQGRWHPTEASIEDLVFEAAESAIGIHKDLEEPKLSLTVSQKKATQYLVEVLLTGEFEGLPAKERCQMLVLVRRTTCDRCSRMAGNYYEATVQIRGRGRPLAPEEQEMAEEIARSQTEKSLEKGDQLSFIQKMGAVKGGIDVVVGSAHQGRLIAKTVQDQLGGNTQESHKLVGRKDGKDVYRINILARLPRLRMGDIIRLHGELLEVQGFEGRRTICTTLEDGRRIFLSEEAADESQLLGNRKDSQKSVVVAKDRDVLEILDPESYRTVFASRPRGLETAPGREVEVLRSGEDLIVLPPPIL